jgi:hypothetical protein
MRGMTRGGTGYVGDDPEWTSPSAWNSEANKFSGQNIAYWNIFSYDVQGQENRSLPPKKEANLHTKVDMHRHAGQLSHAPLGLPNRTRFRRRHGIRRPRRNAIVPNLHQDLGNHRRANMPASEFAQIADCRPCAQRPKREGSRTVDRMFRS